MPLAEPLKDANGNVVQDWTGGRRRVTPRSTTPRSSSTARRSKIPIPTLCHLPHMKPVAVCRLCVVQIYGQKRGKRAAERKLLPACQHPVKNGMEVFTMNAEGPDGERVRQSVKVVTELLAGDHLKPAPQPEVAKELAPFNELGQMAERTGANAARFRLPVLSQPPPPAPARAGRRGLDASSPVFTVDHSACILCDRCVRACDDVMENNVIGRTGKGNTAGHRLRLERADGRIHLRAMRRVHGLLPHDRDHLQAGRARQTARRRRACRNSFRRRIVARSGLRRRAAEVPPLATGIGRSAKSPRRAGGLPNGRARATRPSSSNRASWKWWRR